MECWVVKIRNAGCNDRELNAEKIHNIRMIILCTITDIVQNTGKLLNTGTATVITKTTELHKIIGYRRV